MAEMLENIEYLASQIGPRPAATEEEQQAALYIEERFKEIGLPTETEEFQDAVSNRKTKLICCILMAVGTILSMVLSMFMLPGLLITVVGAGLLIAEEFNIPALSRVVDKGISQNVVARFEPTLSTQEQNSRRRKVVIVAHYDSSYARPETKGFLLRILPVLAKGSRICLIVLPVLMIIKAIFFLHSSGVAAIVINTLQIIALVFALMPLFSMLLQKASGYNDAANCNASGVAVMLEVARRINSGQVEAAKKGEPTIHGAEEAYAQGAVPEGAELVYDVPTFGVAAGVAGAAAGAAVAGEAVAGAFGEPLPEPALPNDPVAQSYQGLLDAKAAIAALTGKPVSNTVSIGFEPPAAAAAAAEAPAEPAGFAGFDEPAFSSFGEDAAYDPAFEADFAAAPAPELAPAPEFAAEQPSAVAEAPAMDAPARGFGLSSSAIPVPAAVAAGVADFGAQNAADTVVAAAPVPESIFVPEVHSDPAVPSWFAAGRAAARKSGLGEQSTNIKRSRFADALDAAEARFNSNYEPVIVPENGVISPLESAAIPAIGSVGAGQARESAVEPLIPAADFAASPLPDIVAPAASYESPYQAAAAAAAAYEAAESAAAAPAAAAPAASAGEQAAAPAASPIAAFGADDFGLELEPAVAAAAESDDFSAFLADDYFTQAAQEAAPAGDPGATVMMPAAFSAASLPSLGVQSNLTSVEAGKQRAPLAQAVEEGTNASAKSLLSMLPSIDAAPANVTNLRSLIPSLSGSMNPVAGADASPSLSGSFTAVAGATAAFAPVTETLALEAENEDEIFVDDADDSAFEGNYTETGAFAGPGYVQMPKKRGGLFSRFRRDKGENDISTNEWLDVDDDFDARSVGAARGGWESFKEENAFGDEPVDDYGDDYGDAFGDDFDDDYDNAYEFVYDPDEDDTWQGGAFSRLKGKKSGRGNKQAADEEYADEEYAAEGYAAEGYAAEGYVDEEYAEPAAQEAPRRGRRSRKNEASAEPDAKEKDRGSRRSRRARGVELPALEQEKEPAGNDAFADAFAAAAAASASAPAESAEPAEPVSSRRSRRSFLDDSEQLSPMEQSIFDFRAATINTEVWFVALGAECDSHSGIKALIAEHAQELRGAMIIELDAMGSGELCRIDKEGIARTVTYPSRMRRFINKAGVVSGIKPGTASLTWNESAASTAANLGQQAMHLVGMEGSKPALFAEAEDVADNVSSQILDENATFIVEMLKNI